MSRSIIYSLSKEEFLDIVEKSETFSDILTKLNLNPSSGNFKTLKRRLREENVDLNKFYNYNSRGNQQLGKIRRRFSTEEILVENSPYVSTSNLKTRLLKEGLLENKCYECGFLPEWNGKPLTFILDHINGINNDNRLINLRLLCPNCNSQMDTFAGRNRKDINYTCFFCNRDTEEKQTICLDCLSKNKEFLIVSISLNETFLNNVKNICLNCGCKVSQGSKLCISCKALYDRKTERPSKEELEELIKTTPFTKIGEIYGVSDNAVRKWCKYYDLPFRRKEIEEYFKQLTT